MPNLAPEPLLHPPIIDFSDFEARRGEIVQDLMQASNGIGFFYITGYTDLIDQKVIDDSFDANKRLMALPKEVKETFVKADWGAAKEIIGYEQKSIGDSGFVRESFSQVYDVHDKMQGSWPSEEHCPGYREASLNFMRAMHPMAKRILSCFATGLGYEADFFDETINVESDANRTTTQFNNYASVEGRTWKDGTNRIMAHTDESLITLLSTSPGSVGLELAAGKDGKAITDGPNGLYEVENWMPCPHIPNTIVVNVGDPLHIWSEGVLRSNYHRCRMPLPHETQGQRMSNGYFVWPRTDDIIQGKNKKMAATTMGEYLKKKGALVDAQYVKDIVGIEDGEPKAIGLPTSGLPTALVEVAA